MEYLKEKDIVGGYEDGTFGPDKAINRAETIKIISKAFKIDTTKDYEELKIEGGDIEDIENKVIKENLGKIKIINEEVIIHNVLNSLNIEKGEGERNSDFEERIVNNFVKVFNLGEIWK